MKEVKWIVDAVDKVDFQQQKAALATVTRVTGSSYRSPGARMLILDNGKWVGSISGGCLEGDALRKARNVMATGKPLSVTYDTREESTQNLGISLGCNGMIDVLIEPLAGSHDEAIATLQKVAETNEPLALATVFSGPLTGQKMMAGRTGLILSNCSDPSLRDQIASDLAAVLHTGRSDTRAYTTGTASSEVFLEAFSPTPHLILFGAGFDARPVSQLAKTLGWTVTVTDECVSHIAPVFFPSADKLSLCDRKFIDRDFSITPYTACILMSHNYEYDRDVLRKVIGTPTPFIGILGPRKRFDKMLADYQREGLELTAEQMSIIHSPVGLDIGAETPEEIALAIIAEIQAVFNRREGGSLRARRGPIHLRDDADEQVLKQAFITSH